MESDRKYLAIWKRLLAYLIDILPIIIIVFSYRYYFSGFDIVLSRYFENRQDILARIEFLDERNFIRNLSFIFWILYSILLEASSFQGTLGKRMMGGKVISIHGERLSLLRSCLRNFSKIISALPLFLGFIWIVVSKKRQTWHDKIARTYVVDQIKMKN